MKRYRKTHGFFGQRDGGFSLIESMVALVVLSVGLLGVARMYVHSLQSGRTALLHSQAVSLASDIAERIRANRTASASYMAPNGTGDGVNNACVNGGIDCTPVQLAGNDIFLWQADVATLLPAGTGVIAVNNATLPPTFTITLSWNEPGLPAPVVYQLNVQI